MATLDNKSIRGGLNAVFRYNEKPDKNLPPDGLANAAAYIRGEHSVERLYSRGHNGCSSNPELAIQQFRACEALYYRKKGGAREAGMADGKLPIVAEHFFLSFPPHENVPYKTQCEIADKLCASDVLKDFYATSNRHWNTDNDHSHILVSNYAKDGSKKLGMNNAKRNALRKELDRICALDYGLSVIDDPGLRWNDTEREMFIYNLVEEGKVEVYAPADYKKILKPDRAYDVWMLRMIHEGRVRVAEGVSTNREWDEEAGKYHGVTQAEAYSKWIAAQPVFHHEKDKKAAKAKKNVLISEEDTKKKKAARVYYWDPQYKSSKKKGYYYAVRRYDDYGYHKPLLLLLIELIFLAVKHEELYFYEKYPNAKREPPREVCYAKTDYKLQRIADAMRYQSEQGVRSLDETRSRAEAVGREISEARKGLAYYKRTIEKGEDLRKAIHTFNVMDMRSNKRELTEEEEMIRKEAYRIMAAHKCTSPADTGNFMARYNFAKKKVKDLEEQIPKLKKDYHDLKFIESYMAEEQAKMELYIYRNADTHSLDDILGRIEAARPQNKPSKEIEKIF